MRPGELVGFRESAPYDCGVVESTDLALLPDGPGWSARENAGGLGVRRLTWHCPEPDTTPTAPAPFPALHLDEPVDSCRTFGLRHREVAVADDPAHGAVPHV
ncbi:hypothetical protein ACFV4N_04080 [Actinosynnema sp. NPDC059797]